MLKQCVKFAQNSMGQIPSNLFDLLFSFHFLFLDPSLLNIGQDKFIALKSRSGENLFYNHIIPNRNENKNSQQIRHLANF